MTSGNENESRSRPPLVLGRLNARDSDAATDDDESASDKRIAAPNKRRKKQQTLTTMFASSATNTSSSSTASTVPATTTTLPTNAAIGVFDGVSTYYWLDASAHDAQLVVAYLLESVDVRKIVLVMGKY